MFPKSMKDVYRTTYIPISIKYFLKINVAFVSCFRQGFNAQNIFPATIEEMKTSRDKKQLQLFWQTPLRHLTVFAMTC